MVFDSLGIWLGISPEEEEEETERDAKTKTSKRRRGIEEGRGEGGRERGKNFLQTSSSSLVCFFAIPLSCGDGVLSLSPFLFFLLRIRAENRMQKNWGEGR